MHSADSWLDRLPSTHSSAFGRLAYISSLRKADTGSCRSAFTDTANVGEFSRTAHERAFIDWLNLSLEQQKADLEQHLLHSQLDPNSFTLDFCRTLPPDSASEVEHDLFMTDLRILIPFFIECPQSGPAKPPLRDWRVCYAANWARDRYGDAVLTLNGVAKTFRISSRHLHRLFHKYAGIPFRAYLRTVRMRHAMSFLGDFSSSIADVAGAVGYRNPSNFARDFRAALGCSPTAYRTRARWTYRFWASSPTAKLNTNVPK